MITVHHLNNSRSQRILWLLEELGLPYEIKRCQRDAVQDRSSKPMACARIVPTRKVHFIYRPRGGPPASERL